MNAKVFSLLSILAFLAFSQLAIVSCRKSKTNDDLDGFTLDLIHRDSPLSPYYNPSITPSQRLRDAFHRSFSRASFFTKASIHPITLSNHAIQSDLIPNSGEYLIKIAIGTPPREIFAIADTGTDLAWIQCKPCTHCFKQPRPLFDPQKSSTYKIIDCHSKECKAVGARSAYCVRKNVCEYKRVYSDNSYTIGDIASETFTFASTTSKTKNISIPHVIFGCGHNNNGSFGNYHTDGLIGLGGSKISIIKRLDKQVQGKFSYCLVPNPLTSSSPPSNATSKINFGPKAIVKGPNVVTTPIIRKFSDTFYFLTLESVSVGEKKLKYFKSSQLNSSSTVPDEDVGNFLFDSGTTWTYLPEEFYNKLESTLVEKIKGKRRENPPDHFSLCYETKSVVDFPKIVFHFTHADIELSPMNTFAEVDGNLTCLTILSGLGLGIYGNLAQVNFHIGFDLVNHKLSFLPTDCTKY